MYLKEELVQPVSHTQISFERFCLVEKVVMMPRVRSRIVYQHVSDFDNGRIVAYRDCGLSYLTSHVLQCLRRLPQHGPSAWRSWLWLPFILHLRKECLQRCDQRRTWTHEWQYVFFSDESRFSLKH
ncbi:hypothetical protein TNCV_5096211 [Trichonephila clavipes]|nr:hypothetical protein TNCV_5096211 [Trichonephila clavipes]